MSRIRNKLACGMAKYARYNEGTLKSTHHVALLRDGTFMYYVNGEPRGEIKMTDFIDADWVLVDTLS